jgi:hypothetical protein
VGGIVVSARNRRGRNENGASYSADGRTRWSPATRPAHATRFTACGLRGESHSSVTPRELRPLSGWAMLRCEECGKEARTEEEALRGFKMAVRRAPQRGRTVPRVHARARTRSPLCPHCLRLEAQILSYCPVVDPLGASVDAPFFRLSRLLGFAAAARQRPTRRVRQRPRVARVVTSAGRARTARAAPFAAAGRLCPAGGARPTAPAADADTG